MKHTKLFSLLLLLLLLAPQGVSAITLSVTPTLFEMSAVPSQAWKSSVKVINNNKQDLTIYAQVVNFAPQGETGQGKFMPVFGDFTEGKTLAEWITVPADSVTIPRESSVEIPISVQLPSDAAPGGHFAAIMIGTKPPDDDNAFHVRTSQVVTSLFFVRVAGNVIENGTVRTFRVVDPFIDTPEAHFEVRFENKGNVHLQPQGEIVITNMWGKERGVVPINHQTHFGNVLPDSIRKFDFTWKGERSITDIGKYKAVLTLGYGQDQKKFSTQVANFWVVPVKPLLTVLGSLLAIILFASWAVRSYVRRILEMSHGNTYVPPSQRIVKRQVKDGDVMIQKRISVADPIMSGMGDYKQRLRKTEALGEVIKTSLDFIYTYKKFFAGISVAIFAVVLIWYFFTEVLTSQRDYEVVIENPDVDITISSEDIHYEKNQNNDYEEVSKNAQDTIQPPQSYELILVNSSDTPGAAADLQRTLINKLYTVADLKSDLDGSKEKTVIVYDIEIQEDALQLSKDLGGVLLSANNLDINTNADTITVYIGNDYQLTHRSVDQ